MYCVSLIKHNAVPVLWRARQYFWDCTVTRNLQFPVSSAMFHLCVGVCLCFLNKGHFPLHTIQPNQGLLIICFRMFYQNKFLMIIFVSGCQTELLLQHCWHYKPVFEAMWWANLGWHLQAARICFWGHLHITSVNSALSLCISLQAMLSYTDV